MRTSFVTLLVTVACSSIAQAQTNEVPFTGIGFATCGQYVEVADQTVYVGGAVQWVYGYWSAYNRALAQTGQKMKDILDSSVRPDPLSAQILAICQAEPDLLIVFAADRIFERLPDSTAGNP